MKKIIALAALGLVLLSGWLIHSKVARARRETAYRAAIAPFEHDLSIGMARAEVQKCLGSRKVAYHTTTIGGREGDTFLIEIGEEPGGIVCEPWKVYVALEFSSADTLRDVHITKFGTCL